MISLQKIFEYSACPHGTLHTVKVFQKSVAIEYFKSIDPEITPEQVILIGGVKSRNAFPVEILADISPTNTNI